MKISPFRTLIVSHGKSGSTGLYFKILNSIDQAIGSFEPHNFQEIRPHLESREALIAKVLLPDASKFLNNIIPEFSKRVLLIRDLRDVLVSSFLYNSAYDILWAKPVNEIEEALRLLEEKQRNPNCISLTKLFRIIWGEGSLDDVFQRTKSVTRSFINLLDTYSDIFVFRYEDLINENFKELEAYLGVALNGTAIVSSDFRRVVRTKSSGSWRDWYLPEDVKAFKPVFKEYMEIFGYNWHNWELHQNPRIEPCHAADYVKKIVFEKRECSFKK